MHARSKMDDDIATRERTLPIGAAVNAPHCNILNVCEQLAGLPGNAAHLETPRHGRIA
jgi:hypothetical protein